MPRILLIDDDPSLLDALTLAFEDAGYEVLVARDGVTGAELVNREKPALVVSDINMPRLDGFALCRKIRAAGSSIPVILLSSRDGEIDESLGLDLGADDYVSKPFSTRVLLARVAALLRRAEARAVPERCSSISPSAGARTRRSSRTSCTSSRTPSPPSASRPTRWRPPAPVTRAPSAPRACSATARSASTHSSPNS